MIDFLSLLLRGLALRALFGPDFDRKERAEAARRLTITGPLPGDRERVRG